MASRFVGRDYSSLRQEIIDFLRNRLPQTWDYTNLADPVVIFAESLARVGDQLHYTIDELRRECDMATARRASSIYSYATREGYKLMLPRGSFGTLLLNADPSQSDIIEININKFDEISTSNGDNLVVAEDVSGTLCSPIDEDYIKSLSSGDDAIVNYASYVNSIRSRTKRVPVVIGRKEEFKFSYGDINSDSTVELPNILIDRNLLSLVRNSTVDGDVPLLYVDDIIGSGFNPKSYTITPKFINGAITLIIEFPTNYKDLFKQSDRFTFTYVSIVDSFISDTEENAKSINLSKYIIPVEGHENDPELASGVKYIVTFDGSIKGYTEYEDSNITRENYKKYLQNYSSLLTKDDYANYIKANKTQHCQVFDHSDMYRDGVLPLNAGLIPRTMYILTDGDYNSRSELWYDLTERSSRSDCIVIMPYGKNPYSIVVKAECYLLGTSVSSITSQIKTALLKYYNDEFNTRTPDESMINYIVHKASDKVIRMESCIIHDTTFGGIDKTFINVSNLSNDDVDRLYNALSVEQNKIEHYGDFSGLSDTYKEYVLGTYNYSTSYTEPVTITFFIAHKSEEPYSNYYTDETTPDAQAYNSYMNDNYHLFWNTRDNYDFPNSVDDSDYNEKFSASYKKFVEDKLVLPLTYVKYSNADEKDFDGSFPEIYEVKPDNTETVINTYEKLVSKQIVYGALDSKNWDYKDTEIFKYDFNGRDVAVIYFKFKIREEYGGDGREWYISSKDTNFSSDYINPEKTDTSEWIKQLTCTPRDSGAYATICNNVFLSDDDPGKVAIEYPAGAPIDVIDYIGYTARGIDDNYIKHHYMTPVLNNVIVLIKAVSK